MHSNDMTISVIGRVRPYLHVLAPNFLPITGELCPQTGAFGAARDAGISSTSGTCFPGGPPV